MRTRGRRRLYWTLGILAGLAVLGVLAWWLLPRPLRVIAKLGEAEAYQYQMQPAEHGILVTTRDGLTRLYDWSDGHVRWCVQGIPRNPPASSASGRYLVTPVWRQGYVHLSMWEDGRLLGTAALGRNLECVSVAPQDSGECWAWEGPDGSEAPRGPDAKIWVVRHGRVYATGHLPVVARRGTAMSTDGRVFMVSSDTGTDLFRTRIRGGRLTFTPYYHVPVRGRLVCGGMVLTEAGMLYTPTGPPRRLGAGWLHAVVEEGRSYYVHEYMGGYRRERCHYVRPLTGEHWVFTAHAYTSRVLFAPGGRHVAEYTEEHTVAVPAPLQRALGPVGRWLERLLYRPRRLTVYERPGRPRAVLSLRTSASFRWSAGRRYYYDGYHTYLAPHAPRLVLDAMSRDGKTGTAFLLGW